jgi:hypothetical protein
MQLAYVQNGAPALPGMLYDLIRPDTESLAAEGVVAIAAPVRRGTIPAKQCVQLSGAVGQGALAVGVAMLHADFEQAAGVVQYNATDPVTVVRAGRMWVNVNDAVTAGNVANYHLASGKFTDDAVAAGIEAFTQLRIRFLTSTTGAGLAAVEISPI